jgi:hypothetical protein
MSAAKAIAYYRTSSATNVGTDKDSLARQKAAVTAYAKAHGIRIVHEAYDAAVSGADPHRSPSRHPRHAGPHRR